MNYFLLLWLLVVLPLQADNNTAKTTSGSAQSFDFPLTRLTEKLYIIYGPFSLPDEINQGFRNNPLIILTSEGVVVCDPGGSASAGQMVINKIKTLTKAPIAAVFVSHAHGDHWLGNEAIKDAFPNVVIYGHANAKKKINSGDGHQWLDTINRLTKKKANGTRVVAPEKTVAHGNVIQIGDLSFRIHHTGTAHTEGDIMVEIVEENAIFMGDVVRNQFLGLMEGDSSFKGNIDAIDYLVKKNMKLYIPGHGKAGDANMIKQYRTYLSTVYEKVKGLYSSGIADFEMKPQIEKSLANFRNWEGFDMRLGAHISQAYLEVEAEEF